MTWFWFTMLSVAVTGLCRVLPELYEPGGLAAHAVAGFACFAFVQIAANWICLKVVRSAFDAQQYDAFVRSRGVAAVQSACYEIDADHLRCGPAEGSFRIAASVLIPTTGSRPATTLADLSHVVEMQTDDAQCGRRVVYPYWSWKWCRLCGLQVPPRACHCRRCRACILKRDHHCHFAGACVGARNQRHFVVFTFWVSVASFLSVAHALAYARLDFMQRNSAWDLLLPVCAVRWWLRRGARAFDVFGVTSLYSLVWFAGLCACLFAHHIRLIRDGVTSFEAAHDIKVTNGNSVGERMREVFGRRWALNFLCPFLHLVYPSTSDGVTWANIKA